jgi:hypothetical protein
MDDKKCLGTMMSELERRYFVVAIGRLYFL